MWRNCGEINTLVSASYSQMLTDTKCCALPATVPTMHPAAKSSPPPPLFGDPPGAAAIRHRLPALGVALRHRRGNRAGLDNRVWSGTPIRDIRCCSHPLIGVPYLHPGPPHIGSPERAPANVALAEVGDRGCLVEQLLNLSKPTTNRSAAAGDLLPPHRRVQLRERFATSRGGDGEVSGLGVHSVGFVLIRAADFSAKSAQAPRPYRQALTKTIWRGSDRVDVQ